MSVFALQQPRTRWSRLTWRFPATRPLEAEAWWRRASALDDLPGVHAARVSPLEGFVEVPENGYGLPLVQQLWAAADRSPPVPERELTSRWRFPERFFDLCYKHQRDAFMWLVAARGGLLADEMGLGKTRTAALSADALVQADEPRLIIGPLYVRNTWRMELARCGLLRGPEDFAELRGFDAESTEFTRARWWFCHPDVIAHWHSRLNFNPRGRARVAIIDELHHFRNARTKRVKAVMNTTAPIPSRIGLTGTPMPNRPADLWAPLTILDGPKSWGHPAAFRERYCGATRDDYGLRDGFPTNTEELRTRLEGRWMRRTKAEVGLDMPPIVRQTITTTLTKTDQDAHNAQLHGYTIKPADLVDMLMTRSITEDVLRLLGDLRRITSYAKIATTVEYVESAVAQGASVVVFAHERKIVERLASLIAHVTKVETSVITGAANIATRDQLVASFQRADRGDGTDERVLVATYGALKEGVTLTHASVVVLHDLGWVPDELLQAEARVHRIGQHEPVQSVWHVAEQSIDTIFARVLEMKAAAGSSVLDMGDAARAIAETKLLAAVGAPTLGEEVERLFEVWR